jgi:hypothetical protein
MTHTYNSIYLEGRGQEDLNSMPAKAKSYQEPISTNKADMVVWFSGGESRSKASPEQKLKSLSKK